MSTVTLIPSDKQMVLDGKAAEFDLGLAANIHAIQWDGSKGHIEYNDGKPNEDITEFEEADWVAKHKQALLDAEAAEAAEAKKVADAMTYKEKREDAYAVMGNQFEMMYDDKINDTTTWVDAIAAVKKAIPKE